MYGEHEKPERIVPYAILSLLRGERLELTEGEQAKDYTYLGDVVEAFLLAAERYREAAGATVNIGSGATITMRQLVEEIMRHFPGSEGLVAFGAKPYRPDEMWFQGTRVDRAREVLGWRAATSLADGIARTVAWYRANAHRYASPA
jgi:nucleoside-diphosphate-sugar epimerase